MEVFEICRVCVVLGHSLPKMIAPLEHGVLGNVAFELRHRPLWFLSFFVRGELRLRSHNLSKHPVAFHGVSVVGFMSRRRLLLLQMVSRVFACEKPCLCV